MTAASEDLFGGRARIAARAVLAARRLNLRGWDSPGRIASAPAVVCSGGGCAVLFRYGALVSFGASGEEETALVAGLGARLEGPYAEPETEDLDLVLAPSDEGLFPDGALALAAFDPPRLQVVADALAKSVVLARYETAVAEAFDAVEPLAEGLQGRGRSRVRGRDLERLIGRALAIGHRMVGRAAVDEKPDALWERPDLERLYLRLDEEYELRERHLALERKLELIARTAATVLSLQHNRRSLRVEWLIVALILVEVVLYVYELLP